LTASQPTLVPLYFERMSSSVWRIVPITASRLTTWLPSPRSARWAALIALTAPIVLRSMQGICTSAHRLIHLNTSAGMLPGASPVRPVRAPRATPHPEAAGQNPLLCYTAIDTDPHRCADASRKVRFLLFVKQSS
jgi:hypothetical protein